MCAKKLPPGVRDSFFLCHPGGQQIGYGVSSFCLGLLEGVAVDVQRYYLINGVIFYTKRKAKQAVHRRIQEANHRNYDGRPS